jgi:hypothetical protein
MLILKESWIERVSPARFSFRFLAHMDRPRPRYELLLILIFFRDSNDFRSKTTFFVQFKRNPFGKIILFGYYKFVKSYPCFWDIRGV